MTSKNQKSASNGEIKTLLVMASGGDAPGMNPALRSVTRCWLAQKENSFHYKVIACRDGYNGLANFGIKRVDLNREKVSGILSRGGCEIGAGRCDALKDNNSKERQEVEKTLSDLRTNENLKGIVVIGGNGSFTGMVDVIQKECGIRAVGIPATIDNDIRGTDLSLGVDTALNTAVEIIDKIRDTALAIGRPIVVELMGRDCGYLALAAAIATEAEAVFLPERDVSFSDLVALQKNQENLIEAGLKDSVIIIAEGSRIKRKTLENLFGIFINKDVRSVVPGYALRGGSPSAMDRILGCRFGFHAVRSISTATDKNSKIVTLQGTEIEVKDNVEDILNKSGKNARIDDEMFKELLEIQDTLSIYKDIPNYSEKVGGALLLIHGADAPGINAAIRAFTRIALQPGKFDTGGRRFRTIAVRDGFSGLSTQDLEAPCSIGDYFIDLNWRNTVGFTLAGGVPTMLSQNPIDPIRASCRRWLQPGENIDEAVGRMSMNIKDYIQQKAKVGENCRIDIIVVIGGRDALEWIKKIKETNFPLPIIFIPASIDNDLCFTDYSIGFDTAVNNAVKAIDNIKETALAEGRIFLIETMGGLSGFLPLTIGLASGAEHIFFPELFKNPGPQIAEINRVAEEIKLRFQSAGKTHSIIVCHESVIEDLGGIDAVTKIFRDSQTVDNMSYEVRKTVLGYILRGGHPSAFDRILATRMGAAAAFGIPDVLHNSNGNKFQKGFAVGLQNNKIIPISFDELSNNRQSRLKLQLEKMKGLAEIHCSLANDEWMKERLENITLFSDDWVAYDSNKRNIELWKEFWEKRVQHVGKLVSDDS